MDSWLFVAAVALVAAGVVMVYSASAIVAHDRFGDSAFFFKRQAIWAALGMMALAVTQRIHYARLRAFTPLLLFLTATALVLVLVPGIGRVAGGARRWIAIAGPFAFQLGEGDRRQRILAFLNPWRDPQGAGFHIIQSLLALGSGGLLGLGLGNSRQKFFYLPEQHTDFIFAILGEELGLIGAVAVVVLFGLVAVRGFRIAREAPDRYGSLLAAGITLMIVLQAIINIGVTTGVLPITGVPLPFVSFGGSSLLFTLISVGILLNISQYGRPDAPPGVRGL